MTRQLLYGCPSTEGPPELRFLRSELTSSELTFLALTPGRMVVLPLNDATGQPGPEYTRVDTWHVPDNLKARYISNALEDGGTAPIHPPVAQLRTPTSRPRKRTAVDNQIDGIAGKNGHEIDWHILEESYVEINTDHERCRGGLVTKGARAKVWHADTGPRVMTGPIPPQHRMDQEQLETLAEKYTGKRKTESYRDPERVKRAWREARRSRTAAAWKEAYRQRQDSGSVAAWEGRMRATGGCSGSSRPKKRLRGILTSRRPQRRSKSARMVG